MRFLLAAATIGVLWTPPATGTAIIRGRITAADGSSPLARAEVTLRSDGDRQALLFTDADGHYEFDRLPPGRYTVQAGRAGYVTTDRGQWIALADKQTRDSVDFALARGGAIEVTVVDDAGEPLADVAILAAHGVPRLWPESARPPRTDEHGHARLFDLAPGTYYLTAKADDTRPPTFYPGTAVAAEAKPLQVAATQTVSVQMVMGSPKAGESNGAAAQGRISGRVVAAAGSAALPDATVTLIAADYSLVSHRVRTDADGRYEFVNLADGYYALRAERRGYAMLQHGERANRGVARLVRVAGGHARERVDFALQKGASLAVRVVDELGNPHAGVQVRLGGSHHADTDDRGEVQYRDLPPDTYTVIASLLVDNVRIMPAADAPRDRAFTYVPTLIRDVTLDAGQERSVQLTLTPTRAIQVAGRAINADGTPARGDVLLLDPAIVNVEPIPRAHLGADGHFLFPEVWPGRYVVETASNPRDYGSAIVDVLNEDVSDLVIKTTPAGTLRGRVVFEGGQPPAGASPADFSVSAYFHADTIEHRADAQIADDWSFALTGVVGPSLVSAFGNKDNGWIVSRITRDGADVTRVPMQDASNLQVMLTRASIVEGTVVDREGNRAIYCGVLVFSEGAAGSARVVYIGRSDEHGVFSIGVVSPGNYFVVALPSAIDDEITAPASLDRLQRHGARITIPASGGVTLELTLPLSEPDQQY